MAIRDLNPKIYKTLKREHIYIALSFIFVVSIIFRFLYLGTNLPGLYNDELYSLLSAYTQLNHIGYLTVPGYNLSDFVFYTINGYIPSILLFHTNPFSARVPNALYGTLMIFPTYLLAKELFNKKGVALIASFLWAISPSAIVTSRVGYGVEIFPLFLFIFSVFFLDKVFTFSNAKVFAFFSCILYPDHLLLLNSDLGSDSGGRNSTVHNHSKIKVQICIKEIQ